MAIGAERYSERVLPKRAANALRTAIDLLTDFIHEDLRHLGPDSVLGDEHHLLGYLPTKYQLNYARLFVQRFLACVTVVGWKLHDSREHMLACVAEELALNALITVAKGVLEIEDQDAEGEPVDFDALEDVAYEDMDFQFLFDMSMDGIENTDTGRNLRIVNLPFGDWFKPFTGRVVHPYASPGGAATTDTAGETSEDGGP